MDMFRIHRFRRRAKGLSTLELLWFWPWNRNWSRILALFLMTNHGDSASAHFHWNHRNRLQFLSWFQEPRAQKAGVCVVFHGQPCNAPRSYSSRLGFPHSGFVLEGEHQPFHMSERIAAQSDKLLMKNVTIFALYSGKKIEVELIQRFQR